MSFNEHDWIRAAVRDVISRKKTSQHALIDVMDDDMAKRKQPAALSAENSDTDKTQRLPCKRRGLIERSSEPFLTAINLLEFPDVEPPLESGYRLKYADDTMRIWLHGDELFVQIEHKVDDRWTVTESYR